MKTRTERSGPLTPDELAELLALVVHFARLATKPATVSGVKVHAAEATRIHASDWSTGIAASRTDRDGGHSPGAVSRPTETHAAAVSNDPAAWWNLELATAWRALGDRLDKLIQLTTMIDEVTKVDPNARPARAGAGLCRACDHNATGVGDDRLRSGLCDPCRQRFRRSGSDDLPAWVRQRRTDLDLPRLHPDREYDYVRDGQR